MPKRDLIAGVQVLLEREELKIAKGLRELGPLMRELTDVRSTAGIGGRVRLGADGCGEHDDLVIALALACWRAKRGQIGFGARRLPGFKKRRLSVQGCRFHRSYSPAGITIRTPRIWLWPRPHNSAQAIS